jgi:hypothetical protein
MSDVQALITLFRFQRARLALLRDGDDRGSVTLEKVVITAIMVSIAIAVGVILMNRAKDTANNIQSPP